MSFHEAPSLSINGAPRCQPRFSPERPIIHCLLIVRLATIALTMSCLVTVMVSSTKGVVIVVRAL